MGERGGGGAVDHETGRPSGPRASPRVVHDGVEPVSDGEDGTVIKLRPDGGLNEIVRFQVHGRCGLVQYQDLRLPQQGPGQAHKLALPDARPGKKDQEMTVKPTPDAEPRPKLRGGRGDPVCCSDQESTSTSHICSHISHTNQSARSSC